MTAQELLQQMGISLETARQFLISNISSPQAIYNIAAQYNVTFEMLAEIYGDDSISGDIVKSFFSNQGFDTTSDSPIIEDIIEDENPSNDDDVFSYDLDSLLSLDTSEFSAESWDQILTEYQASLANFDWTAFGDELSQLLLEFDWDAWALEIQELANSLATDGSWLTEFESWYESILGTDFDEVFDRSGWVWDDVDLYLDAIDDALAEFDFSAIDWSLYETSLTQLGLTVTDMEAIFSQLDNLDLSYYADLFATLGLDGYDLNSQQVQPVGVSIEATIELA